MKYFPALRVFLATVCVLLFSACSSGDKIPIFGGASQKWGIERNAQVKGAPRVAIRSADSSISPEGLQDNEAMSPHAVSDDKLVRVGVLLPLTGPAERIGQALKKAALVALFEIGGDKLVLQFYDTQGTPDGAVSAAAEASAHGVNLLLGPVFSASVHAVAPQARAAGLPVVAFSTDPSATGEGVYTIGLMVSQQVERIVSYALQNGHRRFAVMAPDSPAGTSIVQTMQAVIDYHATNPAYAPDMDVLAAMEAERLAAAEADAAKALLKAEGNQYLPPVESFDNMMSSGDTQNAALDLLPKNYDADKLAEIPEPVNPLAFLPMLTQTGYFDPQTTDFTQTVKAISSYDVRHQAIEDERARIEALIEQAEAAQKDVPEDERVKDEVLEAALKKLEAYDTIGHADFDAILIAAGGSQLRSAAAMLSYYDVFPTHVQYLGTALWNDPTTYMESSLYNGWFSTLPSDAYDSFARRYKQTFGDQPPRIVSLAYDAVALAAVVTENVDSNGQINPEELVNPNGFLGIDGIFRLLPDGRCERGLAVVKVTKDGPEQLQPAPATFEVPLYVYSNQAGQQAVMPQQENLDYGEWSLFAEPNAGYVGVGPDATNTPEAELPQ